MIFSTKPLLSAAAIALAAGLFSTGSAAAQSTRTWVSGAGSDTNPCTRAAPCQTFQAAIDRTATGGEVNCLDAAGFGPLYITTSISVVCDGMGASVFAYNANPNPNPNGILINALETDTVFISGLDIEGDGTGFNGLFIAHGGMVTIRNTIFRRFIVGVNFQSNDDLPSSLLLDHVTVVENGNSQTNTGGILVRRPDNRASTLIVDHSWIANNRNFGLRIDTTGFSGATITATLKDSDLINNSVGILVKAPTYGSPASLSVQDSLVTRNTSAGILVNGIAAAARLGNTTVSDNATGVIASNGAVLGSFGDNRLIGNTTNGAFTMPLLPKN